MIGQGSPRRLSASPVIATLVATMMALSVAAQSPNRSQSHDRPTSSATVPASDAPMPGDEIPLSDVPHEAMRIRIDWGGGEDRTWKGAITIEGGAFSRPRTLGIESDRSCRLMPNRKTVIVAQQTARTYDGLDLSITGPLSAVVTIRLTAGDRTQTAAGEARRENEIQISLSDLLSGGHSNNLDDRGNRLMVQRWPGDQLRVEFSRKSMIFSPGEKFAIRVRPHRLSVEENTPLRFLAELIEARGGASIWSQTFDVKSTAEGTDPEEISLSIDMPEREGAYDLVITARIWGLRQRFDPARRFVPGKPLARRAVELLVLDSQASDPPVGKEGAAETEQIVTELDPAHPGWWQRIARLPQLSHVPGLPKGPWNNGKSTTWRHPQLGRASRIAVGGWSAFPLPIDSPGRPHILEIDTPPDAPLALGISIIEPNSSGEVVPIGLDSGLYVEQGERRLGRGWSKHRLIFWPRTSAPIVLLTNRHDHTGAVFGKIRVLSTATDHLSRAAAIPSRDSKLPGRMIASYMDRPLLPENFHASESTDLQSGRSLDDWITFHQAGTRLVEYLRHVGHGGMMLGVMADGSTIYPTDLIDPTPRYDTGAFFSSGQDPLRKDVLEMLFRMFDRQGLKLIPAISFDAPLSELETLLAEGGLAAAGIEPIGPDGRTSAARRLQGSAKPTLYNGVNPRVQQAMLRVVRELVSRYGHHRSFGGLALQLSGDSFSVLPGADSCLDDGTIASFERDTGLAIRGKGPSRFAIRARALDTAPLRKRWLRWRAARLTDFHARASRAVMAADADAKLYLAAGRVFEGPAMKRRLHSSLTQPKSVTGALLEIGLDVSLYQQGRLSNVVFLRPRRIAPRVARERQAVAAVVNRSGRLDRLIARTPSPGELFYHQPMTLRLTSFDQQSPFGADKTYTWLVSQMSPSARSNRRRFVHALATTDALMMFDGGWMIPLGQEDSLKTFIDVYRRLPAKRFATVTADSRPVTIRRMTDSDGTIVYLANDSPWDTTVAMQLEVGRGCRITSLSPAQDVGRFRRSGGKVRWSVKLRPYDLVAARLSDTQARIVKAAVSLDPGVEQELTERVRELTEDVAALSKPVPLTVLKNPGFEAPAAGGQIPGWIASPAAGGIDIGIVRDTARGASNFVRIRSDGPHAYVVSEWFAAPRTGRLAIQLALRTGDAKHQPPLRVGIESRSSGKTEYRWAPVGAKPAHVALTSRWSQYIFPFDNLPLGKADELRICFDLVGKGNIETDDVQLFDLHFEINELRGLSKIVSLANLQLSPGQLAQCAQTLDGYWPRFLLDNRSHRPAGQAKVAGRGPPPNKDTPKKETETRMFDRLKKLRPF